MPVPISSRNNASLAAILERMSKLMDLLGEDSFKSSAHARAARAVEGQSRELASVIAGADDAASKAELMKIDGIGQKLADKIIVFYKTGTIPEHDELAAQVPPGLLRMIEIPGLGPKTARAIWQTLNVTDLAALKKAIDDGSILTVPRMGAKAAEKIKASMSIAEQGQQRLALGVALPLAQRIVRHLAEIPGVERVEYAGSLRRGRETVGDIDVLVCVGADKRGGADAKVSKAVSEAFRTMPGVMQVLVAGDGRASVRLSTSADLGRWSEGEAPVGPSVQCDLRVLPSASFGAALMYFTGSKEHNVALRQRALDRGMTLSDYGLFPHKKGDDAKPPPQERGVKPIAAATEESIYKALELPYFPPEVREGRGELDATETPRLIEVADIKAELHAHTTASDGSMSIEELASRAKERGFHTIAVTDHSQSSSIAGGLKPDRLMLHIEAIRKAQERFLDRSGKHTITILAGSEVDILADGSLDYTDKVLKSLDVVVASPHAALTQDPGAATSRLLRALANPHLHILGHPTGRLINRRAGLAPDMGKVFEIARERNVALEINAHWMRLDLRDTHVRGAIDAGCLIAIDCDVHAPDDFDNLLFGVLTARRGWVTPDRCVNAWPAKKLHEWLKSKR
jgi:DNA polymerase (family 10)